MSNIRRCSHTLVDVYVRRLIINIKITHVEHRKIIFSSFLLNLFHHTIGAFVFDCSTPALL